MEKRAKRIIYGQIECPTCGNTTSEKLTYEAQKCEWCRRLFKVTVTGKGRKSIWSADVVNFESKNLIPEYKRAHR